MRLTALLFGFLFFTCAAFSQPTPEVKKLVVNSTPAYVLLGVQPENIQRPSTPREFIGSLQSAVVNKQLQPNFAFETNPFAWKDKKKSNEFYVNDYFYKPEESWKKNFGISVATSASDTVIFGELQKGLGLAYGIRTTIIPGKVNPKIAEALKAWEREEIKSIFFNILLTETIAGKNTFNTEQLVSYYKTVEDRVLKDEVGPPEDRKYILGEHKKKLLEEIKTLALGYANIPAEKFSQQFDIHQQENDSLKQVMADRVNAINSSYSVAFERYGFTLELAAAGVTVFQENQWAQSHFGKAAIWLTPSYRFSVPGKNDEDLTQSMDAMAIFRYIFNDGMVDKADYFDFGAKVQYNKVKWNSSFELVARHASEVPENIKSKWTSCWLFSFSYNIKEDYSFKFSFGSNFDGNTTTYTDKNDMIMVAGVNLSIF